jgi:hypothetical protein
MTSLPVCNSPQWFLYVFWLLFAVGLFTGIPVGMMLSRLSERFATWILSPIDRWVAARAEKSSGERS